MRTLTKVLALILCLLMLCACSKPVDPAATNTPSEAPGKSEITDETVLMTVNGDDITYGYFMTVFEQSYNYYSSLGADLSTKEEQKKLMRGVLSELVLTTVELQKIEEFNLRDFSEAELEEINYVAQNTFASYLENGDDVSFESILAYTKDDYALWKLKQYATKDITVSQEDLRVTYDESFKRMKEYLDKDSSLFPAYWNANILMLIRPEGYGAYQWIHIPLEEIEVTTLNNLQADKHADYAGRREQALAAIHEEAQTIYDSIVSGTTTFEAAFETKGAGTYFTAETVPQGIGYCIGEGNSELYPEVKAAALTLKTGEMSGLVAANDGYYIIKRVADIESGELSFDEAKGYLESSALDTKKEESYKSIRIGWANEANIQAFYDFWSE